MMDPQMSMINVGGFSLGTGLPASGAGGILAKQNEDAGSDLIHFIAEDADSALVGALRDYGCKVFIHQFDRETSALVDTPNAGIVVDMPQTSKSFSICRQLRTEGVQQPLLTLTTSADPFDEVLGLELGADGIVNRQIHPRVLLARLRAVSRRAQGVSAAAPPLVLRFGALRIDGQNRDVTLREARVMMTAGEFDLLWMLAQNAGQVVRRDVLLRRLRGLTDVRESRSVDARLYRLRQRFVDTPDIATRLKSVRPYGYMFANIAW